MLAIAFIAFFSFRYQSRRRTNPPTKDTCTRYQDLVLSYMRVRSSIYHYVYGSTVTRVPLFQLQQPDPSGIPSFTTLTNNLLGTIISCTEEGESYTLLLAEGHYAQTT